MHKTLSRRRGLRRLLGETLESRQLMAFDVVHHNFMMPEDSDMSGSVTPLDVLAIINRLNTPSDSTLEDNEAAGQTIAFDVDADGSLSPLDVLTVINFINRTNDGDGIPFSQVNVQNRIERLEEAIDSDLLPPNVDLVMATQIREILRAGGFPEIGDRMVNGVLMRQTVAPGSSDVPESTTAGEGIVNEGQSDNADAASSGIDDPATSTNVSPGEFDSPIPDLSEVIRALEESGVDVDLPGFEFIGNTGRSGGSEGGERAAVNDPTNDNGNGFFAVGDSAKKITDFVEIELRKALKVNEDASIRVAVFGNPGEVISGTWFYLTKEGVGVSGNWSYVSDKPETLNLFRSNVEVEKRIYVQYPGSGFIYYSWLPDGPVGYYFSPINNALDFKDYFDKLPGSSATEIAGFVSYSGELGVFDGIAAIEQQASDLYAIDLESASK